MILSKKIAIFFILLCSLINRGEAIELSDSSKISVLTCAPGQWAILGIWPWWHPGYWLQRKFWRCFQLRDLWWPTTGLLFQLCKRQDDLQHYLWQFSRFYVGIYRRKRGVIEQDLRLTNEDKKRYLNFCIQTLCLKTAITRTTFFGITAPRVRAIYLKKFLEAV